MKRILSAVVLAPLSLLFACQKNQEMEPRYEIQRVDSDPVGDSYYADAGGGAAPQYSDTAAPRYEDSAASAQYVPSGEPLIPIQRTDFIAGASYEGGGSAGRTHLVQRGDTLFALARRYYGNASRWRDIYTSNRDQISDPNRVPVGTRLVIP